MDSKIQKVLSRVSLREKYSVRIQEKSDQEKLRIWTIFMQCMRQLFFRKYFSEAAVQKCS